uniref:Dipeptidyl peptidase IV n=1 Tax=Parastrongyloides trichosuri TaxID=131310 RepID=A0A0N5A1Z3_PARTI
MRFVGASTSNTPTNEEIKSKIIRVKTEVKAGIPVKLGSPRVYTNLFNGKYKNVVVGLAPGPAPESQNIYVGEIPLNSNIIKCNIELVPYNKVINFSNGFKSSETIMLYERLRSTQLHGVNEYHVSHDGQYMLLLAGGNVLQLDGESVKNRSETIHKPIMRARLSPANPKFIAMTEGKEIFVYYEDTMVFQTITDDNYKYNGVSANVIQEELERYEGFWWSPTRSQLLYEEVDETGVETTSLSEKENSTNNKMKYPTVNTENPRSNLRLLTIEENGNEYRTETKVITNDLLKKFWPSFEYISKVSWTPDGNYIYLQLLDRLQKTSILLLVPLKAFENFDDALDNGKIIEIVKITGNPWINVDHQLECFYEEKQHAYGFIYGSEEQNYHHLYLKYAFINGNEITISKEAINLTYEENGEFCVIKDIPIFVDQKRGNVFFVANYNKPWNFQLCYTNYKEGTRIIQVTPIDKSVKYDRSTLTLDINPDFGFAVNMSSIFTRPKLVFYRCEFDEDGNYRIREGGEIIHKEALTTIPDIRTSSIVYPQIFKLQSKKSNQNLYGCVFIPKGEDKNFPVLQYVYNGPCAQLVQNNWELTAKFQMYTINNIAVVIVDGRGSANRGKNFEKGIYKNLGTVEVDDQIEYLHAANKYVAKERFDLSRVAIQGWSYGGFMSVRCLQKAPNVYKGAIAGGTVTDWLMYDSIYTERYMGLPDFSNSECHYKKCSLLEDVDKLPEKRNRLMLVHGKLDDNVHYKHIERLMKKLDEYGKPYELIPLEHERHGVKSPQTGEMLEIKYIDFLNRLFSTSEDNE